eukprot:Mrub_05050.p1 GENE.Mrub_05050~~Mrub_05050.p1  ORF type:complete len:172 (-),score=23.02 Mrub_05050:535-1050(-)
MIFKLFQIHTYISLILPILFQLYYDTLEEFESVEHSSYMPHIMAIGAYFSCLLKPMIGRLDCWGNNSAGQTDVPGLLQGQVHSVKAEQSCVCALSISRELLCWGSPFSSAADHANTGVQDYSIANDASYMCVTLIWNGGKDNLNAYGCQFNILIELDYHMINYLYFSIYIN